MLAKKKSNRKNCLSYIYLEDNALKDFYILKNCSKKLSFWENIQAIFIHVIYLNEWRVILHAEVSPF